MDNVGLMAALANAMAKAPTAEQVTNAVDAWLDDHPEATTTVTDGAITNAKLASSFVTPGTAAAYSSSAMYAVGDYVFYGGTLYRCTTAITTAESWTAAHWTVAVIGNDVSDLKSALHDIVDDYYDSETAPKDLPYSSDRNSGIMGTNGSVISNDSYVYTQKIPVTQGDIITAFGTSGTNPNFQATLNAIAAYNGDSADSDKGVALNYSTKTYTVPAGIDWVIITYLASVTDVVIHRYVPQFTEYTPKIEKYEGIISSSAKTVAVLKSPTIVSGKFVSKAGVIGDGASYSYFIVDDLKTGDVVNVRAYYGSNNSIIAPTLSFICAYNAQGDPVEASGATSVSGGTFTVPSNIVKLAISYLSSTNTIESVTVITTDTVDALATNPTIESSVLSTYPQSVSQNLASSGTMQIAGNSVKKNYDILFNGFITSLNKLTFGRGTNDLNSLKVEIDGTNVVLYNGTASAVTVAHSLTFANYISISFHVGNDRVPKITITTGGGRFEHEFEGINCVGCNPKIYITADGSTALTTCVLSFVCEDIDFPLWVFGDSYVSYSIERWPYWMHQLGFDGYLLNGYSGEPSGYAVQDLLNLLTYGKPKYLVWALGMNDPDESSSVSAVWKSCFDEVCGLCNKYGITLIACTIPNVPSVSNTYKNAIITASDYKIIDFASAVGALNDSTWFTGMLSQDNIHPSQTGAYALASAVLKAMPYIGIK